MIFLFFFKNWIQVNLCYVKDLVKENGVMLTDEELYNMIINKQNLIMEIYIVKRVLRRYLANCNTLLAKGINITKSIMFINGNHRYILCNQSSNAFYNMLKKRGQERNYMEMRLSQRFKFENTELVWSNIYKQKVIQMHDKKLAEFNFKVLHNIVACGSLIARWDKNINAKCDYCGHEENTEHMLFNCARINNIWKSVSKALSTNITWKTLTCGFIQLEITKKVDFFNMIITRIMYSIFKINSKSKFENSAYNALNIRQLIRCELEYHKQILQCTKNGIYSVKLYDDIIKTL